MAISKGESWSFMGIATAVIAAVIYQLLPFWGKPADVDGAALVANALVAEPRTATARLESVTVETVAEQDGLAGVRIHVRLRTANLQGAAGRVIAYFSDASGRPLEDDDGRFADRGQVATTTDFSPAGASTLDEDLPLFVPYAQLPLDPGNHALHVQIVLVANDFADPLAESAPIRFEATIPD